MKSMCGRGLSSLPRWICRLTSKYSTGQERERMQRFHFAPDRARYAVAHANLRRILGAYLHQPRPAFASTPTSSANPNWTMVIRRLHFHFSLSHSRSIALLAVANGRPVGVDVEEVRPIEPEVADSHFSASERSQLNQLQGDAWLRLLPLLDAQGGNPQSGRSGLSRALDSFDVSLLPDERRSCWGRGNILVIHGRCTICYRPKARSGRSPPRIPMPGWHVSVL